MSDDPAPGGGRWLTAAQAARRLGVKPETLYAYVSRGRLQRMTAPDGRSSLFEAGEVERLGTRARARPGGGGPALDVPVVTSVTSIVDGRLRYRGHDAVDLARSASFEDVAVLLWTGALPARPVRWTATPVARAAARRAAGALAQGASVFDVLAAATMAVASTEPLRVDLSPGSVVRSGELLLAALVEVAGAEPSRPPAGSDIAAALWPRLTDQAPTRARTAVLRAALVVLADHELATSTLAARVAASTRADPFAVVMAGLATASGPYHGSASERVHRLLLDAAERGPAAALAERHRSGQHYPGFGHILYGGIDPRAAHLLELLESTAGRRPWSLVAAVAEEAGARSGLHPNVDYALAALAMTAGMRPDAGAFLFGFARVVGWIAHALEEYGERPLRFRTRAVYDEAAPVLTHTP
jgi:citrate synthase